MSFNFEWKIKGNLLKAMQHAENRKDFQSPIFDIFTGQYILNLYPNGQDKSAEGYLELQLIFILLKPPGKVKYAQIHFETMVSMLEINKTVFSTVKMKLGDFIFKDLNVKNVPLSSIRDCKTLTIKLEVEITQVLDKENNDITHLYTDQQEQKQSQKLNSQQSKQSQSNENQLDAVIKTISEVSSKIDKIEQRMNKMDLRMYDIELRENEEQKSNDNDKYTELLKEIALMKQNISKLNINNIDDTVTDAEKQKLKLWLEKHVKLPQYYSLFIHNGIEDLETAALLTMPGLKGMGIDKVGHQMKILSAIVKIKEKDNDEGAASYI